MSKTATEYELLEKIKVFELEIKKLKKQKKYGLVWEDKPEKIVEDCKTNVPILRLKEKSKTINPIITTDDSRDDNILIEGDNYHALSVLNYTHKGKIDVIYIDPPYNTGSNDFIYNDKIVDKEDTFRHSKWVSFMEKRLRLAKELLKKDGAIFVSIDDNEQAHLKVLCDHIFGEENFIDCIVWDKKSSAKGVPPKNMMVNVHEYILSYQKGDGFKFIGKERTEESGKFKNPDNDPRGPWRESNIKSTTKSADQAFTIVDPRTGKSYTNTWAFSKNSLDRMIDEGRILWKDSLPKQKEFMFEMSNENMAITSNWGVFDAQSTTVFLKEILPDVKFDNPKPINLIEYLLKVVLKKDATILDFFAGSGTTGHAVLDLNKQDGGNRKFILCTNNENNICEEVTYERIKRVISGYKGKDGEKVEGIGGNLRYYKTDLVNIEKLHNTPDQAKVKLTYQAGEMIGLKENTLTEVEKNEWWQIFEGKNKTTAIYFKEDKEKLVELVDKLESKKQKTVLYIFSWGKNEYKSEYSSQYIKVEDIPEPILEVYKEINKI